MSINNLRKLLNDADQDTVLAGQSWYSNAKNEAFILASKYSTYIEVTASVIAALSPRNKWEWNLQDADNVLSHVFINTPLKKCTTFTFNVNKAIKLCDENLSHIERLSILNGIKVKSFYLNILGIDTAVTIDTWIDLAFSGKYKKMKKRKNLTLTRYKKIENIFFKLGQEYQMKPYALQAIVWLQFQKMIGVKKYASKNI